MTYHPWPSSDTRRSKLKTEHLDPIVLADAYKGKPILPRGEGITLSFPPGLRGGGDVARHWPALRRAACTGASFM